MVDIGMSDRDGQAVMEAVERAPTVDEVRARLEAFESCPRRLTMTALDLSDPETAVEGFGPDQYPGA